LVSGHCAADLAAVGWSRPRAGRAGKTLGRGGERRREQEGEERDSVDKKIERERG
jgi:hypothetical protein